MTRYPEYPPFSELSPHLFEAYTKTFIHRRDCYPMQLDKGNYVTLKQPLTHELIKAHFKGLVTLGAYALDENSTAHWLCLDADQEAIWQQMEAAAKSLRDTGITPYLERSRRGGHLWLFTPSLPGKIVREFGKGLIHRYSLPSLPKLELYPKQDTLKTGVGSLVRLPLGIHRITGKRYHFVTPDDEPLAATIREQMVLLSNPRLVPLTFIDQIRLELPKPAPPTPKPLPLQRNEVSSGEPLSERLKSAISVYDFVSRYVELDEHGKGFCPFHNDTVESFQVNQTANYWSCYAGCGGGSIIDFHMKWREKQGQDSSFIATIRDLAKMLLP